MIWFWIWDVALGVLEWLVSLLPTVALDTSSFSSIREFFEAIGFLNRYFPLSEMLAALVVYLTAMAALHSGNLVRRLLSLFTGGGGS